MRVRKRVRTKAAWGLAAAGAIGLAAACGGSTSPSGGDGTPPPAQALTMVPARADLDRTPLRESSIAQGNVRQDLTFVMTGIHGPRRLALAGHPPDWDLKSVVANGVDVTDAPLPFGTPGQSLANVQIVITNRLTELMGTVVDSRGQPATGYTVLVFPSNRERWYPGSRYFRRVSPESPAYFTVRGLPPAEYFVAPVVSELSVLTDGFDAWQDPEFLESIALRAATAMLTDGQKLSVSARLITP